MRRHTPTVARAEATAAAGRAAQRAAGPPSCRHGSVQLVGQTATGPGLPADVVRAGWETGDEAEEAAEREAEGLEAATEGKEATEGAADR